ncbi:MAG TPA: DUF3772 domain-containing protein [Thermohalobaculum sp.]|nr:DUF3772 domain-containing protein [Thermohalobaculum sp.]
MRLIRWLGPILLLALALVLPMVATAQPTADRGGGAEAARLLEIWDAEAANIEERLDAEEPLPEEALTALRGQLEEQKAAIPPVLQQAEAAAEPIRQQLEALGPPPEEGAQEADTVAVERRRLEQQLAQAEALVKRLSQADARAGTLISEIMAERRARFTQQLLTRGPSVLEPETVAQGLATIRATAASVVAEVAARRAADAFDMRALAQNLAPLLVLVAVVGALGMLRRATVVRLTRMIGPESGQGRSIAIGTALTLTRLVLPAASLGIVLLAVYRSETLGEQGLAFLHGIAWGFLFFVGAYVLSLAFFAPGAARLRLSRLDDHEAAYAHWWLVALAAVVALDRALFISGEVIGMPIEALTLLNAALLVPGGIALWQVIGRMAVWQTAPRSTPDEIAAEHEESPDDEPDSGEERTVLPRVMGFFRLFGRLAAVTAPLLAILGYFAASRFLFHPVVFSGALICLFLMLFYVVQAGAEGLVARWTAEGQVTERRKGQIRLIPVLVGFVLTCAAIPLLALIWGATVTDLLLVWRVVRDGLEIGEVQIVPADFVAFLLVFMIGFALTRLIQAVLRRSVLPLTSLDTGGRDAIRAGVGYIGVFLAALAAISFAGVDLSNLAIALGALSVGIGFGLQNVVNNFVSGIILLIERPIKTGDWVELVSGMGYVKRINVRSTEIETFDRSALIVPNSELISAPVTNWTHSNNHGRIIVPIGVAHGSNPRKVERILLEIARGHPMLLRRPAPFVLFQGFGPDALKFEIRGILRDVNWVLNVGSDINYEIARRFSEEGIRIPYAQRDLHVRNLDEIASAFGVSPGEAAGRRAGTTRPRERAAEAAGPDGDEDEHYGVALLGPADASGRGLVAGSPDDEVEGAPWETLEKAGEALDERRPEDMARSQPRRGTAAGPADGDGAGEGR